ncbi:ACT domain-containing protein ACR8-like [Canna indica]|uniref:ACT domain-containing protein ACR n=1 Tax=Canna indica TaxID=4628 RepID=A0AAQ3KZT9_9LILI|nr:ACT domain-containing protein ACR8-like [Canna indica]
MAWPAYLNEYEKLVIRMDTPRVVIDNAVCPTATLVKVDSARKHGILLEAVQVLADLNLSVKKAYISSDGRWFMDVFHVTDQFGRKLADDSVISYLEQSLDTEDDGLRRACCAETFTALELTGADRPGLLSEVFAVLADLGCGVVEAKIWTHNGRIACLVSVKDELTGSAIDDDAQRIHHIESRLLHVLKGDRGGCSARIVVSSVAVAQADRRLHQMMFADRDYERASPSAASSSSPAVSVQNWAEKGYSVVTVQCRDRSKLLFDMVCTLTDMEYVVFHGKIDTDGDLAHQEFYIRHKDGSPINSEAERQRMIQCLQAAIERRASEGLRLELCMEDRPGLLSDLTRTFRENGLLVRSSEISTKGDMALCVFYVTNVAGRPADTKVIDAVRQRIGPDCLIVMEEQQPQLRRRAADDGREEAQGSGGVGNGLFYLGNLFWRNLYNLGLIKSCS